MKITSVKISIPGPQNDHRLLAYVAIELDECFMVTGLRLIQGATRMLVQMPNRRDKSGEHRDIAFPVTLEFRSMMEEMIIKKYLEMECGE